MPVTLHLVTVSGKRHAVEVQQPVAAAALYEAAAAQLQLQPGRFKLLLRGALIQPSGIGDTPGLQDGGESS